MDAKASMRAQTLAARNALPASVRAEKSARICQELEQIFDEMEALRQRAPVAERPVVTAFSCMGSEVDVASFVRAVFARNALVAYPCMVKNPAWTNGATCAPRKSDAVRGARCAPFTPRLLMQFREVSRAQFETGAAPFVAKPICSFAPDDPALEAFPLVEPRQVDFAVCPLVAFDAAGNRLGYGGGNYDGFLACARPDTIVVGVGFAEQEAPVGAIPTEPHDLSLPRIVSA